MSCQTEFAKFGAQTITEQGRGRNGLANYRHCLFHGCLLTHCCFFRGLHSNIGRDRDRLHICYAPFGVGFVEKKVEDSSRR